MKDLLFKVLFLFSAFAFSNNTIPATDGVKNVNGAPKNKVGNYFQQEKVDSKEVEHLFRKNKRVDRLFRPSKKSTKRKYTIA